MSRDLISQIGRYVVGLASIVLITLFYVHEPTFKTTTVVLTYLLVILIASTVWGLGVSVFMTAVATLTCDYFFFPPAGTLNISDPMDFVALCFFLATSVIGSSLSARVRSQAAAANRQRNEVRRLYEFSQRLLSAHNSLDTLNDISTHLVKAFQAQGATFCLQDEKTSRHSGINHPRFGVDYLKAVALRGEFEIDNEQGLFFGPVRLGGRVVGSFGISGPAFSKETLEALATLIATAIDRARAIELLGKTEAARESERLKSVLLDAIAHDFKTPLTSIKAAATSLLDDLSYNRRQRGELLEVIDEECDRINQVIGEAIEMSRLDAGNVQLKVGPHPVDELISAVLDDCQIIGESRPILTDLRELGALVRCDLFWTRKVFGHLIRNADLYSSPGEPIRISAEEKDGSVLFHIADKGPGIEKSEISQIFDKFYRGKDQRHRVPGTGMGLAVAKAIVEAHGGAIGIVSEVGRGSVFTFSLPISSGSN